MVGLYFLSIEKLSFLEQHSIHRQEGKCTLSWRWDRLVTNLSGHIFVSLITFACLKLTFPVKKDQQKCRLLPRCLLNLKATRSCFRRNSWLPRLCGIHRTSYTQLKRDAYDMFPNYSIQSPRVRAVSYIPEIKITFFWYPSFCFEVSKMQSLQFISCRLPVV